MTMVLVLIGLSVLKVNHAVAIAFLIGLVDLLPYLGAGSVFVPWIVYLAASKQTMYRTPRPIASGSCLDAAK